MAFKRGLNKELVISPYSTFLALEVEPEAAVRNLRRLQNLGLEGRYGLYEAADFTPNRLISGTAFEPVQCFMAHHVGMSLIACDNALNDHIMQRRFMSDPQMAAYSELLQERTPVDAVTVHAAYNEVPEKPRRSTESEWTLAHVGYDPHNPHCHLLSNGSYSVLLTNTGLSQSISEDIQLTRFDGLASEGVSGISFFIRLGDHFISLAPAPFFDPDVRYSAEFDERGCRLYGSFGAVKTCVVSCVPSRDKAELREVKIRASASLTGELICYFEPVLAKQADYTAHPAFSKLFLDAEKDHTGVLIHRRNRSGGDPLYSAFLCSDKEVAFSTSREKALGRGGFSNIRSATAGSVPLTNDSVPDPCVLARVPLQIKEGESKMIRFALSIARSSDNALSAAERTLSLSYRQASNRPIGEATALGLSHAEITSAFEYLKDLYFLTPGRNALAKYILQNHSGQSELWKHSISGDLPIISVLCAANIQPETVSRTIRQYMLLSMGGARFDLVLLLSDGSDYRRPLRTSAADLIRALGAENRLGTPGGIHLVDLQPNDPDYALIASCSSVLIDSSGDCVAETDPVLRKIAWPQRLIPEPEVKKTVHSVPNQALVPVVDRNLRFSMDGSVCFDTGESLPASAWSNVLANRRLGYIAADTGSGYMWRLNARENRINHWTNDTLAIGGDERITISFEGKHVSVFASDDRLPCKVTYGPGYAVWEKQLSSGVLKTTAFIHKDFPCRLIRVEYTGAGKPVLHYFTGLILGDHPSMRRHVVTFKNEGSVYALNHYNTAFQDQSVLFSSNPICDSFTCDRTEALSGIYGGTYGAGYDPCVAMEIPMASQADSNAAILLTAADKDGTDMQKYLALSDPNAYSEALSDNIQYWRDMVSPIEIETPAPELDRYINSWALYQTICCRMLARSSMYQSGGAYGFRDQLQDSCAALLSDPELTKAQILLAAEHQFSEGDVQHWWHPEDSGEKPDKGVRTRCSDDLLWLPYTVSEYIEKTGDVSILDIQAPFILSEPLKEEEHERYAIPEEYGENGNVYEHCLRAIRLVMERGEGEHELSKIGTGDWNDGFNLVGAKGNGESVWLTWFFSIVLKRFAPICALRDDKDRADVYRAYAGKLISAAEKAWDGEWYRRGYYDSGAPLGSKESDECRIDSIAQSFAALAGAERAHSLQAVQSALRHLVDREARLVRLFTPSFKNSRENPGYIKGYPEGVRENGGQYTHAAIWLAMSCFELGLNNDGFELLHMLLPATHDEKIFRVEPYVLAADVYSAEGNVGRGGWSWYTGSAAWYYRAACESLLGIRIINGMLDLKPSIPSDWKGYRAKVRFQGSVWSIQVQRGQAFELLVDGIQSDLNKPIANGVHEVRLVLSE